MSRNSDTYICEECKGIDGIVGACEHCISKVPEWKTVDADDEDLPSVSSEIPPLSGASGDILNDEIVITKSSIESIVQFCVAMATKNMINRIKRDRSTLELHIQQHLYDFMLQKQVKEDVLKTETVLDEIEKEKAGPSLPKSSRHFQFTARGLLLEDPSVAEANADNDNDNIVFLPSDYCMLQTVKKFADDMKRSPAFSTFVEEDKKDLEAEFKAKVKEIEELSSSIFPKHEEGMDLSEGMMNEIHHLYRGVDEGTMRIEPILIYTETKPELPPKRAANELYHHYKDVLKDTPFRFLPDSIRLYRPEHIKMMCSILLNHPKAKEKIGNGVRYFFVRRSITPDEKDVCCFYVKRMDGSIVDFSYHICFGARSWKDDGTHFDSISGKLLKREEVE